MRCRPAPASSPLSRGGILSVGERSRRTYLNFGADWKQDFSVTIPKRSWATMTKGAVSAASLRGRTVRVRGIVETWTGPVMEIVVGDMLEVLDANRRP